MVDGLIEIMVHNGEHANLLGGAGGFWTYP